MQFVNQKISFTLLYFKDQLNFIVLISIPVSLNLSNPCELH